MNAEEVVVGTYAFQGRWSWLFAFIFRYFVALLQTDRNLIGLLFCLLGHFT